MNAALLVSNMALWAAVLLLGFFAPQLHLRRRGTISQLTRKSR